MSNPASNALNELIVGGLKLERQEVQQVIREASFDRRLVALHGAGIVLALGAVIANFAEGEGVRSLYMPGVLVLFMGSVAMVQSASRHRHFADLLSALPDGAAVHYQLGPSAIEIQSAAGVTHLEWSQCRAFAESPHAFLLHAGRVVPEIVYKRAFPENLLPVVRERLGAHVKKHASGRAIAIGLVMGFAVLPRDSLEVIAPRSVFAPLAMFSSSK